MNNKCFHEYDKKKLILADILHLLDNHDRVIIMDDDYSDIVWGPGRAEDIKCTPDECVAHELCDYSVLSLDVASGGELMISVAIEK